MGYSIYIADDELNIRNLICSFLESDGYKVRAFENGDDLMEAFAEKPADLVILDIMMPGTDGLTVCRKLRRDNDVPIIMLSAKDSECDYVEGITVGGDDYLTKPFRPTTLLMRVRSLLRRMEMSNKKVTGDVGNLKIGDLLFSPEANTISCNGQTVAFTQTELRMLSFMMQKPGKAYSREELLEMVWGYDTEVETRVTDETLRRIRRKLSLAGSNVNVRTIWGFGYKVEVVGETK